MLKQNELAAKLIETLLKKKKKVLLRQEINKRGEDTTKIVVGLFKTGFSPKEVGALFHNHEALAFGALEICNEYSKVIGDTFGEVITQRGYEQLHQTTGYANLDSLSLRLPEYKNDKFKAEVAVKFFRSTNRKRMKNKLLKALVIGELWARKTGVPLDLKSKIAIVKHVK